MINFIKSIVSWIIIKAVLAIICWPLYNIFLSEITNIPLGYFQWFAIIAIIDCIFLREILNTPENKQTSTDDRNYLERFFKKGK